MKEKQPGIRLKIDKETDEEDESLRDSIDYLEYHKKDLADLVFTPVYHSLVKKVELI